MREKKIHFVTGLRRDFGGKPFILPHLLAILSARLVYPDHEVFVHYEHEPSGPCWQVAKHHVTRCSVTAPTEVFGRQIRHFAHAADVVRLQVLLEHGGIYFDSDTIVLRAIDDLPQDRVVMGVELGDDLTIMGLCNAFIAAPRQARFLREWLESYRYFNGTEWNRHSVKVPFALAQRQPELIHIEPWRSFFYPSNTPEALKDIFARSVDVSTSYSIHLWETLSWSYVNAITLESIAREDTTYNRRAREVLAAFQDEIGRMSSSDQVAPDAMTRTFAGIYQRDGWGGGSGNGARSVNNIEYCAFLARFLERNFIRSVVDLGCGDWQFSRFINWDGISYLGVDAVPDIVQHNTERFGSATVRFGIFSGLHDLPAADLLLCKDVMQHWPNGMIVEALAAFRGRYRYVLLTNDEEPLDRQNQDIPLGGWRALDLRKPPFQCRAANLLSWYVYDGTLVRKSTLLLLDT